MAIKAKSVAVTNQATYRPDEDAPMAWFDSASGLLTAGSAFFTGSGYLETASDPVFQGVGDIWCSLWVCNSGSAGNFVEKSGEYRLSWNNGLSTVQLDVWDVSGVQTTVTAQSGIMTKNRWHHVLFNQRQAGLEIGLVVDNVAPNYGYTSDRIASTNNSVKLGNGLSGSIDNVYFGQHPSGIDNGYNLSDLSSWFYSSQTNLPYSKLSSSVKTQSNLKAAWSLNEEAGTRFDSHGTYHLTPVNTVGYSYGMVKPCANFAGSSYLMLDHMGGSWPDEAYPDNVDVAVAGWVNFNSLAASQGLFGKGDLSNSAPGLQAYSIHYDQPSGKIVFIVGDSYNSVTVAHPETIVAGTWYFVVGQFKNADLTPRISINNSAWVVGSAMPGTWASNTKPFSIGYLKGNFANARIRNVLLFYGVMSDAQKNTLYNGGHPPYWLDIPTDIRYNLWCYYELREQSGTRYSRTNMNALAEVIPVVTDNLGGSGRQEQASKTNDPVFVWFDRSSRYNHVQSTPTSHPQLNPSGINGKPSLSFDGIRDVLLTNFNLDITTQKKLTVVIVARADYAANKFMPITFQRSSLQDYTSGLCLYISPAASGQLDLVLGRGDGGTVNFRQFRYANPMTTYSVITYVISTTSVSAYLNGVLQGTTVTGSITLASWLSQGSGNHRLLVGGRNSLANNTIDFFHDGDIAQIAVYDQELDNASRQQVERYMGAKYGIMVA